MKRQIGRYNTIEKDHITNRHERRDSMDIAALSTAMNMAELQNDVGVAVLDKSMETVEELGEGMVKMMEASVMPGLGQNIDFSV